MHKFSSNLKISNFKFFLGNPPKIPVFRICMAYHSNINYLVPVLEVHVFTIPSNKTSLPAPMSEFPRKIWGGGPKVELNPKAPITLCNFLSKLSHNALAIQVAVQCNMGCLTIFLLCEALHQVELSFTFCNGLNSN